MAKTFVVARNPDPDTTLPFLRLPVPRRLTDDWTFRYPEAEGVAFESAAAKGENGDGDDDEVGRD